MHQSTRGERITAVISTVVAIALLGAAVTAQQSQAPRADYLASLESDLRLQLDFAFRQNGQALKTHVAKLEATLGAWRESAQSAEDFDLLVKWMQAAIRQTMPGRKGELPPTPEFGAIPAPIVAPAPPPVVEPAPTPADEPAAPQDADTATAPTSDAFVVPPATEPAIVAAEGIAEEPQASEPIEFEATAAEAPLDAPVAGAPAAPVEHSITVPPLVETAVAEPEPAVADPDPAVAVVTEEQAPAAPEAAPAPPAVRINVAELNARIEGYHQGLDEIEATIVANRELSPRQLTALVGQLEQLASQYQFVRLYYHALTADEQSGAVAPRSIVDAIDLVAAQVAAASGDDLLQDFDAEHADHPTLVERLQAVANATLADGEPRQAAGPGSAAPMLASGRLRELH